MSQKVTVETQQTYTHKRNYLPNDGPDRVGILPGGIEPPARPVTKRSPEGTNTRTVERPAQGHTVRQSANPSGSPESRTATHGSLPG